MKSFYTLVVFLCSLTAIAQAQSTEFFREVDYPVSQVFIPEGFDDNDAIQFVVQGNFPNSCYQVGNLDTQLDTETNKLYVKLTAYEYKGKCSEFPSPFHLEVYAGLLGRAGSYGVYDKNTGLYLGALNVEKAKPVGAGTDEITYAPILDAFLNQSAEKNELVIRGAFAWSCLKVSKVKVIVQRDVVVVLPEVGKIEGEKCVVEHTPFEEKVIVSDPLPKKEFLLHARSSGGQAINKMVHPR